jgi:O6-methylguanine-DNA--protein-cysteine methyltransferase
MSYYTLPEEIMENYDDLQIWIDNSLQVPVIPKKKEKTDEEKAFDRSILEYLLKIPNGKVSTYKILADRFEVHPRKIASVMKYNTYP